MAGPRKVRLTGILLVAGLGVCSSVFGQAAQVTVGSKAFTENVVLAEIITQLLDSNGIPATHRRELGGTRILWDAMLKGDIDIYPEYSGTLMHEIFSTDGIGDLQQLGRQLDRLGIGMSRPLGFNNTYVLGMLRRSADTRQIRRISDLDRYPDLKLGFSNEFMARADGWPGLKDLYQLQHTRVTGLDHDLAYRGLASGELDVIDLYATDAEIPYYDISGLVDDKEYFPAYLALILYRRDTAAQFPELERELDSLGGRIDEATMAKMNAEVKLNGQSESRVAAGFLNDVFEMDTAPRQDGRVNEIIRHSREHIMLVMVSLSMAIIVAVPLGVAAARRPRLGQAVLALTGMIQTIPALALLVFMIPLLGIGGPPAIVALFLYSLLPIVRNTYSGLKDIPVPLIESATVMGLPGLARLRLIELPLAMRQILAGIKTSAVINIGTATLGALIGAGGYGQPILTGIRLNDTGLILEGAVPAAILALLVQGAFEVVEKLALPRGLRLPLQDRVRQQD